MPAIAATLSFALDILPDLLAPGVSDISAGLKSVEAFNFPIRGGDSIFHRVFYPENCDNNYSGTLGPDESFRLGTFPSIENLGSGSAGGPVQDPLGLPLQLPTLRAILVRIQPRVPYLAAPATATILSDNINPTNGDTITTGSKTYTYKTLLTATEGEIKIGATADLTLLNTAYAHNHTGTPGTDYYCAAAHPEFAADAAVTVVSSSIHTLGLTALVPGAAGNLLPTTSTAAHFTFQSATAVGGADTATPLTPAPLDGTVTILLENGLLPGGSTATHKAVCTSPGLHIFALEEPWTPEPGASFTIAFQTSLPSPATDQDTNAVVTLALIATT